MTSTRRVLYGAGICLLPRYVAGAALVCALFGTLGLDAQPTARVVSVVPAITEMLYAMGAGDTVVGVTDYDRVPEDVRRKPKVGALLDPNLEAMLALRPTLAVVHASQLDLQRQLGRSGVDYFVYKHGGLAEIPAQVRAIGQKVGRAQAGNTLADTIERDVDRVRQRYRKGQRPRTLLVIGRELGALRTILVSGGRGFLHDMLTAAGGENVMAEVDRENVQVSIETLIVRDPEVILELVGGSGSPAQDDAESDWKGLPPSAKGTRRRVVVLSDPDLTIPGPRVAEAIERLASAIGRQELPR